MFGGFLLHGKELPRPGSAAGQAERWGKAHHAWRISCHQLRGRCPQNHWQKESMHGSEIQSLRCDSELYFKLWGIKRWYF